MNVIDKNFYELTSYLKSLTCEDLYIIIKSKFKELNIETQKIFEDYFKKFDYWGKLDLENNNYEQIYEKALTLTNHIDDYIWLYDNLGDYRSKKTLYAIINNWFSYDFNTLNEVRETNYSHYFDLDLINVDKDEVVVDLGAYIGDTVLDYIKNYSEYKKIYCYEITDDIFPILKNNLKDYQNIVFNKKAVGDKNEISYLDYSKVDASANRVKDSGDIKIDTVTIDSDIKEKVSLIKMDIEGFEQKALKGCINHIKNDHPKLLISVYHNNDDIWQIARMINEIDDSYNFYLRYYGGNIYPTEIVLIAI